MTEASPSVGSQGGREVNRVDAASDPRGRWMRPTKIAAAQRVCPTADYRRSMNCGHMDARPNQVTGSSTGGERLADPAHVGRLRLRHRTTAGARVFAALVVLLGFAVPDSSALPPRTSPARPAPPDVAVRPDARGPGSSAFRSAAGKAKTSPGLSCEPTARFTPSTTRALRSAVNATHRGPSRARTSTQVPVRKGSALSW
jgi:hypothetical protein